MRRNLVGISKIRLLHNSTQTYVTKNHNLKISPLTTSSKVSSSFCWKCGVERTNSDIFCEKCNTIQNPQEKHNYFKVLGIQEKFNVDQKQLGATFRRFQSLIHPDKFSNSTSEEQTISEEYSSLINKAYSNLLSPLKRAEHLLLLNGESIAESQTVDDSEFLMKMMMLNEEVEDAEQNIEQLKQLDEKNKNEIEKLTKEIDSHFQNRNIEAAKKAIIRWPAAPKALISQAKVQACMELFRISYITGQYFIHE